MQNIKFYKGREQTYLKHYVLENYLEKLFYIIGYSWDRLDTICYIDCFAGPWMANSENYDDTSISISLNVLKKVKEGLNEHGKDKHFKAIFIEKDIKKFNELENLLEKEKIIETKAIHGKFENNVDKIVKEIEDSFSFFFIDPTGWKGYSFHKIRDIIQRQNSELIINFMYDYIKRFIGKEEQEDNFTNLFGSEEWKTIDLNNHDKERKIVDLYKKTLKEKGDWKFVTNTPILYPCRDSTYFHLIYATRHISGLLEYKKIDKYLLNEQTKARKKAKRNKNGFEQLKIFQKDIDPYIENSIESNFPIMKERYKKIVKDLNTIKYEHILGNLLQIPLIHKKDIDNYTMELKKRKKIKIENWKKRQQIPKRENYIISKF
jgi:three-Cys-motif partner protein